MGADHRCPFWLFWLKHIWWFRFPTETVAGSSIHLFLLAHLPSPHLDRKSDSAQGSQYKGMLQNCLEIPAVEKMPSARLASGCPNLLSVSVVLGVG